jgi:hypothetical protein
VLARTIIVSVTSVAEAVLELPLLLLLLLMPVVLVVLVMVELGISDARKSASMLSKSLSAFAVAT